LSWDVQSGKLIDSGSLPPQADNTQRFSRSSQGNSIVYLPAPEHELYHFRTILIIGLLSSDNETWFLDLAVVESGPGLAGV
jgi:hypothetical protein